MLSVLGFCRNMRVYVKFPNRSPPPHKTFQNIKLRFRETAQSKANRAGQPRQTRTVKVESIQNTVEENLTTSARIGNMK